MDDNDAHVVGPGEFLSGQSVFSRSGEYRLAHHDDGDVAVHRVADDVPVWRTGTVAPGGHSRFGLTDDGDLVVVDGSGNTLWSSGTGGRSMVEAVLRDAGWLGLRDEGGFFVWRTPVTPMPISWEGWERRGDGQTLRRGETLRYGSLTSPAGAFVFTVDDTGQAILRDADGEVVWSTLWTTPGCGLSLDDDGALTWRAADGSLRWGWLGRGDDPGVPLHGDEFRVTDAGVLVLQNVSGEVVWSSTAPVPVSVPAPDPEPPRFVRSDREPDERLRTSSTPLVRTDFSDLAGWVELLRRLAETPGPAGAAGVEAIDDPAFDGLAPEHLMSMLPDDEHAVVFVADAATFARPEQSELSVLVVSLSDDGDEDYSEDGLFFRAIPEAVSTIDLNLSLANCDWDDLAQQAEPDGVVRTSYE
ncbi:DUF6924 domain-containing protein [Kineosporia succinea]|uniref:Bulb-type lectin domain-containing protein n=1 Tax=Kineosporia succinea TaxID=84632 RepID=A0ABT9P2H1_9ACTN|nr:hypothetical protein [Kineosporia succinea]MDP9826879.1 hypothetical protein [Kineosporia succinea]